MGLTKYYYVEHETGYRRIESEHKANWDALHEGSTSFDDFASRAFLAEALARLHLIRPDRRIGIRLRHRVRSMLLRRARLPR